MRRLFGALPTMMGALLIASSCALADKPADKPVAETPKPAAAAAAPISSFSPTAPDLKVKGYVLLSADSGQVLAAKNPDEKLEPASLTKMMTLYVASGAIKAGKITLDTPITISENAWRTGGSRMFVKLGTQVPVKDLLQGIIVASGNDACVALAEQIAGTEASFAELMNQTAKQLGMKNSHFLDSTGLPNADHYSSARDLATLARALIHDHPEHYDWYKQKWFTYNNIKQPNRNRLLWRDESVDGLKTGHTDGAGYCLVASAKRKDTRLIAAVLGSASESERANDTEALLNFGFHFFESAKVFSANQKLIEPRTWLGQSKTIPMGVSENFVVSIPTGKAKDIKTNIVMDPEVRAPIVKGEQYGTVKVMIDDKEVASTPLVALADNPVGGIWKRCVDHIALLFHSWFG